MNSDSISLSILEDGGDGFLRGGDDFMAGGDLFLLLEGVVILMWELMVLFLLCLGDLLVVVSASSSWALSSLCKVSKGYKTVSFHIK